MPSIDDRRVGLRREQRVQIGLLDQCELADPAGAVRVVVNQLGRVLQRLVHVCDRTRGGSEYLAGGFDGLDLPERITNSVDALDVGQSLKVAELNMPEGVSTKMDGEVLVALIGKSRATTAAAAKGGGEGGDSGESGAGA